MRKLKIFVAVLMLVFVLGIAVPQAFADGGETQGPNLTDPGDGHGPGSPGQIETPGITADEPPGGTGGEVQPNGEILLPGILDVLAILFGISWSG